MAFISSRSKPIIIIGFLFFLPGIRATNGLAGDADKYDPSTLVFPSFLHTYGIRKATRFHLFLFTQNKVQFNDPQGLAVTRLLSWEDSMTTKDDDEVTVYGVNSGQNNIIFNASMKSLGIYGLKETGDQRLNQPHGIAANEKGEVYVADTGNHRIVKLFNPGHDLIYQKSVGGKGRDRSQFNGPRGVALDSQGILFVTDTGNHRIQVFSADFRYLYHWGQAGQKAGQLWLPDAIAVADKQQAWTRYREDFVVIIDRDHSRIQQFDFHGKLLKSISAAEFGHADCHLSYVALDYYNNIYVTDTRHHCIHKFDHQLNYLTSFGRHGDGDKEFVEPRGITIYRRFGQVLVAEKWGAQYYWIGTDCFDFRVETMPRQNWFQFSYFLTEPAFISTDILDSDNRLVTRLWTRQFKQSGSQTDFWSGSIRAVDDSVFIKEKRKPSPQYQKGKLISPGRYFVRYKIEPTYSSYHYFEKIIVKEFRK